VTSESQNAVSELEMMKRTFMADLRDVDCASLEGSA
jgi:hypothetical protein